MSKGHKIGVPYRHTKYYWELKEESGFKVKNSEKCQKSWKSEKSVSHSWTEFGGWMGGSKPWFKGLPSAIQKHSVSVVYCNFIIILY